MGVVATRSDAKRIKRNEKRRNLLIVATAPVMLWPRANDTDLLFECGRWIKLLTLRPMQEVSTRQSTTTHWDGLLERPVKEKALQASEVVEKLQG